jgi:hypothetical protein
VIGVIVENESVELFKDIGGVEPDLVWTER